MAKDAELSLALGAHFDNICFSGLQQESWAQLCVGWQQAAALSCATRRHCACRHGMHVVGMHVLNVCTTARPPLPLLLLQMRDPWRIRIHYCPPTPLLACALISAPLPSPQALQTKSSSAPSPSDKPRTMGHTIGGLADPMEDPLGGLADPMEDLLGGPVGQVAIAGMGSETSCPGALQAIAGVSGGGGSVGVQPVAGGDRASAAAVAGERRQVLCQGGQGGLEGGQH